MKSVYTNRWNAIKYDDRNPRRILGITPCVYYNIMYIANSPVADHDEWA